MSEFWDFSLKTYGRRGVADLCLGLQDSKEIDVNLLLFCLWAGSRGQAITSQEMGSALASVGPWQREVVATFRALRRRLKDDDPRPGSELDALRTQAKRRELDTERVEQHILEPILTVSVAGPANPAVAMANLELYFRSLGLGLDDDLKATLTELVNLAFDEPCENGRDGRSGGL